MNFFILFNDKFQAEPKKKKKPKEAILSDENYRIVTVFSHLSIKFEFLSFILLSFIFFKKKLIKSEEKKGKQIHNS